MSGQKQHFLLAPFAAFGHYIPFMELARRLIKQGHTVTLYAAKNELDHLRDRKILTTEDEAAIRIKDAPYERPAITTVQRDKGAIDVFRLLAGMLQAQVPVTVSLINQTLTELKGSAEKTDVVVIDYYYSPAATACQEHGIPYFVFNTGAPLMALSLLTITEETPGDDTTQKWPVLMNYANKDPINSLLKKMSLERQQIISKSKGFILNSFRGLADDLVATVKRSKLLKDIPILQIGPLFEDQQVASAAETELTRTVKRWLDHPAAGSVVYVAFGTMATPTAPQMAELANALLELKRPFIWSLPAHCYPNIPQLSAGFPENQTPESPFLILPWSPQKTILGHQGTGLFVTHCGWNSTFECLAVGKPTVCWPMFSDQYLNAEWLEGLGAGVMVHGTGMNAERVVPAQEIVETFNRVLCGETFKAQAQDWKRKVAAATEPGGSYFSDFSSLLNAAGSGPGSKVATELYGVSPT